MSDNIIYENEIISYLDTFCKDKGISDLKKESQGVWNACMRYIGTNYFKNGSTFNKLIKPNTQCNSYDLVQVERVFNIYIDLCFTYDKEISLYGFSFFTGIDKSTLYDWGNEAHRASSFASDLPKRLRS